jgi:hypothetical protein
LRAELVFIRHGRIRDISSIRGPRPRYYTSACVRKELPRISNPDSGWMAEHISADEVRFRNIHAVGLSGVLIDVYEALTVGARSPSRMTAAKLLLVRSRKCQQRRMDSLSHPDVVFLHCSDVTFLFIV